MTTSRRDLLATALSAAAGVAVNSTGVRAEGTDPDHHHDHDHDHQVVPSDPALRVKALESLLVRSRRTLREKLGQEKQS